jgi:hypothetical protein
VEYAYGSLQGVNFALNAAVAGFPYGSIAMNGLSVQPVPISAPIPPAVQGLPDKKVTLDFSNATTGESYKYTINFQDNKLNTTTSIQILVGSSWTTAQIATAVEAQIAALPSKPYTVSVNGSVVTIAASKATANWTRISVWAMDADGETQAGLVGPVAKGKNIKTAVLDGQD